LAGMLFNLVFVCAHADVKMLRVREAGCIVACCVGARVQASCSGTAHLLCQAWLVCCSIWCLCALMWMLKCCVCEKQAVLLLAVWGRVCKQAAVEQPISCGALMCHVVGAACGPNLYAPPRALPNVRERGTFPSDRALHVPNSGQTLPSAIAHFPFATHLSSNGWPMCSRESQWTARVKAPRKKRAPNPPRGRGVF